MKVLTPAALTPHGGSLRLLCLVFRTSNPQPRYGPEHRFRSRLNALGGSCDPGFAMNEQARRTMPPKRVRHPAGCSFASSCSPPRIAATQLPSATCATTSHRTDFHPPDKTASQTHSFPRKRESRAPARAAKSDRGRKGFRLPSLRTVRAVLPHTALQSLVSSSGVPRAFVSCFEGEQPAIREKDIWPAAVVLESTAAAGTLRLLAQD